MADIGDAQIDAANARAEALRAHEPRAVTARVDSESGKVIVELTNGCTFAFPPRLVQGLEAATDAQIALVALRGAGYGLHWEALDVDLSVGGLLAGLFGTRMHMTSLAQRAKRPAESVAARINGARNSRPRGAVSI